MSYEKAMKHWKNPRKGKPQYMGFNTGISPKESLVQRQRIGHLIRITEWFRDRHEGHPDKQYVRECIREEIQEFRKSFKVA